MNQLIESSVDVRVTKLRKEGLLLIDFPTHLAQRVKVEIFEYFARYAGLELVNRTLEDVTDMLGSIPDKTYESLMPISRRIISRALGFEVEAFVRRSLRGLFGSSRLGVNFIPNADRCANPELEEEQLAIYWRCVRPRKPDVAPAHADCQFWDIVAGTDLDPPVPFSYAQRWKIWVPIIGCDATTSILLVAGSQWESSQYFRTMPSPRGPKPSIAVEYLTEHEHLFECPFREFTGEAVLFHDRLIHRGPMNDSRTIRISMEFTVLAEQGLPGS